MGSMVNEWSSASLNDICSALNVWKALTGTIQCTKDNLNNLEITVLENGSLSALKTNDLMIRWKNTCCEEVRYLRWPEVSIHLDIKLKGSDLSGNSFKIRSVFYGVSRNGGNNWEPPEIQMALWWV